MPAFTLTIDFEYPIQDSVSVGDTAYYVYTHGVGGFNINEADIVEIGEITSISRTEPYSMTCSTDLYGNQLEIGCGEGRKDRDKEGGDEDCGDPFILFSKNNCQELKSVLGYYSLFRFVNTSKDKAELVNGTVDAYESSK